LKLKLPRVCGIDRMPCPLLVMYAYGRKRVQFMLSSDYDYLLYFQHTSSEIPYAKPTLSNLNGYMYECVHECNSFVCVEALSFTGLFQPGSNSRGCPHLLDPFGVED